MARWVFSIVRLDTSPVSTEEQEALEKLLNLNTEDTCIGIERVGFCWEDFDQQIHDLVNVRLRRFLAGALHTTDIRHLIEVEIKEAPPIPVAVS